MDERTSDVLVIGSGFGAAPPALRLAEAGLTVRVLEKGPHVDAPGSFRQTQDPSYFLDYYRGVAGDRLAMTYVEALGGGSGFYEMISLRAPSLAFDQKDEEGRRIWPYGLTRAAMDPYYDVAERLLNVRQIPAGEVPKSGLVFSRMMKNLGYSCDRAAYAEQGCRGSGYCVAGCVYGAKQSLHLNYIPRARQAGAEYVTGMEALRVRARGGDRSGARYEVECRDADGHSCVFRASIVVLAGGTVGTAKLLLRSRSDLAGLSDAVGRRVAFNGGVKTAGLLGSSWPDGDMFTGRSHPGMVSYEFLASHGVTVQAAKPLPLQAIAAARMRIRPDDRYWGEAHMRLMRDYRRRVIVLFALGLTPPTARLELDGDDLVPRLDVSPRLLAYYERTKRLLHSIFEENGCRPLDVEFVDSTGSVRDVPYFATAHQLGSCRMADSPVLGVVDASGEAYGHPGLYVTDGAALPGSIAVSTSLTILANAERIAAGMVERYADRQRVGGRGVAAAGREAA